MKKVKRALLFCVFGLLMVIIFSLILDSNLQRAQGSKYIKESEPNMYSISSYVDLFILDGSPHCKYLFVDVIVSGKIVHKDEDTYTIILQDLNDESRYLRAVVPKEKWTKIKFLPKEQEVYISAYATKLTYFNEPIVEVREVGKI